MIMNDQISFGYVTLINYFTRSVIHKLHVSPLTPLAGPSTASQSKSTGRQFSKGFIKCEVQFTSQESESNLRCVQKRMLLEYRDEARIAFLISHHLLRLKSSFELSMMPYCLIRCGKCLY